MHTEQQNAPEIAPQAESDESKPKSGGKRPGAGRKPNLAKVLLKGVSRTTILASRRERRRGGDHHRPA